MALVKHFKELRVYQQAFEAASRIYKLSKPPMRTSPADW